MPRILIDPFQRSLFTVERAVGRNAPNDRLDVLLVQFQLFLATKSETNLPPLRPLTVPRGLRVATPVAGVTTATPARPRPQGNIYIDGGCGDQTIGFIEYFQARVQNPKAHIDLNGQVAPYGTPGNDTMILLNYAMETALLPYPYYQLYKNDAYPQELSKSFYSF
jgi:hypothetical protein